MKAIKVELALDELALLVSLASDQLFRREFIDPKMPGYQADPGAVRSGKALLGRLRLILDETNKSSSSGGGSNGRASNGATKRANASAV